MRLQKFDAEVKEHNFGQFIQLHISSEFILFLFWSLMVKQHQSCGSLKPKFKEEGNLEHWQPQLQNVFGERFKREKKPKSQVANLEHWQPQLTNVEAALKLEEVVFAKSKTVLVVRFEWFQ